MSKEVAHGIPCDSNFLLPMTISWAMMMGCGLVVGVSWGFSPFVASNFVWVALSQAIITSGRRDDVATVLDLSW
ncbi:hypothetical protein SLA2020_108250 [Shorea laevis]